PTVVPRGKAVIAERRGPVAQSLSEAAKGQRVVLLRCLHTREQVRHQVSITFGGPPQTELGPHPRQPRVTERLEVEVECRLDDLDPFFLVRRDEGQQSLAHPGEVPLTDGGLVAEGIATAVVDRAEDRSRIIGIYERTWPIIDGLTRQS